MEEKHLVSPWDRHNQTLVSNVHPEDWKNPEPAPCYNLVVIGAGTAGLVSAAGAAGLGAKVALVEKQLLGGDCLNVGCVPSKSLIRSSRVCRDILNAGPFGIKVREGIEIDFPQVMERMRSLRAKISYHDSADRFRNMGVDLFLGDAGFLGPGKVSVGGKTLKFKKAVIATGARAAQPPIAGLAEAGYLTNETVFSLTERPRRLVVIGGGPIGCELAQAFRRLGSEVTIVQREPQFLVREDPDAAKVLEEQFSKEGIDVRLGALTKSVSLSGKTRMVRIESKGVVDVLAADEILVGAGRVPNVEGLNLESVGVKYDRKEGIAVNDHLQTTHPDIYAAGDVCLKYKFTHMADATARIVIQNALFLGRKKWSALTVPWCTYTDPEIARVGMEEREARRKGIETETFFKPLNEVDRAIVDGEEEGFVKVHVRKGTDKILGATIVARHAGEMINELSLAIDAGVGLGRLSNLIHPYPTQAEAIKQTGDAYNKTRLTPFVRKIFGRWFALTR